MKKYYSYISLIVLSLALAVSCSEKYEIKKSASETTFLAVESILSDIPGIQTVKLTESIPYSGQDVPKVVSGAVVTVADAQENTFVRYIEDPQQPGVYFSPENYCGLTGHTYNLKIERQTEEGTKTYEASSTMREFGFDIRKVDYKYSDNLLDSLWTIGVWGTDNPQSDYYLILPAVNGYSYPMDYSLPLEDHFFSGATVAGYSIAVLNQTFENVKIYGPCAKPLETGDVVSLVLYDMPEDFYQYMSALVQSASAISIPIISSQPANLPTNLVGDNVVGFFSACPSRVVSCVVDDPYRTKYIEDVPPVPIPAQ